MKNQTISEKLDALMKLQQIDSTLDKIKKLRGDLPDEVRDIEDEIEGCKTRISKFNSEYKNLQDKIKEKKEGIKKAEVLIKKYNAQQKNVKNNREYNAITKELELQELEIQICEKTIKENQEKTKYKKEEIKEIELTIEGFLEELANKNKELKKLLSESEKEESTLFADREKASKNVEEKLLKYYERLRSRLTNGLAVVRVVRGAAEGCNIVIPPQKIAEIRERKKIVIDEHSGRILAHVDMESLKTEKEKKRELKKKKEEQKKKEAEKKKEEKKKQKEAKKKTPVKKKKVKK